MGRVEAVWRFMENKQGACVLSLALLQEDELHIFQ